MRAILNSIKWAVICFTAIAMLTSALAQLEHLNSDEMPNWTWVGWFRFFGYIALAAFFSVGRWLPKPPPDEPPPKSGP